jgi:hypothetical protein
MRKNGRLGDQHKVPRATNDRALADALLAEAGRELSASTVQQEAITKT